MWEQSTFKRYIWLHLAPDRSHYMHLGAPAEKPMGMMEKLSLDVLNFSLTVACKRIDQQVT